MVLVVPAEISPDAASGPGSGCCGAGIDPALDGFSALAVLGHYCRLDCQRRSIVPVCLAAVLCASDAFHTPTGEVGVTRERLAPIGYIRVRGTLWRAELAGGGPPLEAGKTVRVQDRRGLTLIVVPAKEA
jgi:NfeD-like C-terminal, partner-binding